jgi:hypothetical protein
MRQRRLGRWLFGLAAGLVLAVPQTGFGQASQAPPEPIKFETADGVIIKGTFYPSKKGAKAACVLLLHELGGSSQQKGWDELAKKFQAKGLVVLKFDFRGHGKSTGLAEGNPIPAFWAFPANRTLVKGWNNGVKPREKIEFKDLAKNYYPNLINDIAAAKAFLDKKNDAGECNSANLVLVGAKEGATLGALWMKSEWFRHRISGAAFRLPCEIDARPEGKDIVCAVWLSFSTSLGPVDFSPTRLLFLGKDKRAPMAFVYGDQDKPSERVASAVLKKLDPQKKEKQFFAARAIPESKKSKGSELLSKDLETQDWIVNGVEKVLETKGLNDRDEKSVIRNGYVWAFSRLVQILAKEPNKKEGKLIPWDRFR